jgi:hypothetical protein
MSNTNKENGLMTSPEADNQLSHDPLTGDDDFVLQPESEAVYDFSDLVQYSQGKFGVSTNEGGIDVLSLSLKAAQLDNDFVIFEQIPNVESWPVSKLIQRELNHERAKQICDDYLLGGSGVRYFPPLTAVLIPTDDLHQPKDSYDPPCASEIDAIKTKYANRLNNLAPDKFWPVAGGFITIKGGAAAQSGWLAWDKRKLSAVIIDGQHRYRALGFAREKNRNYDHCAVSVQLIDLTKVSKSKGLSPTAAARDLFVTINNTPVEVDEARLVLMDDKEAISTFTQVLVDDSEREYPPAVRPELIDWRCEQGKHDTSLALTGVLTLWSVLSFALVKGKSIASLNDRLNQRTVKRWCDAMNSWLGADVVIERALGPAETLNARYKLAYASVAPAQADDEETPFLFTYNSAVAAQLRSEFKRRYAGAFKRVFEELAPFASFQKIAEANKAFDSKSKLHAYLRSFRARREELYRADPNTKASVDEYKNRVKDLTDSRLLYTVMGQKAIFYVLLNNYLAEQDLWDSTAIASATKEFVVAFNEVHERLQQSSSVSDDFFNTGFLPKYDRKSPMPQAAKSCKNFWKGIIVKANGELDYGGPATKILAAILVDVLTHESGEEFAFSREVRGSIIKRHESILQVGGYEADDVNDVAECAVVAKERVLQRMLNNTP